ncbi:MAG: hypothetical protein HY092_03905 [Candidatus Kerfeldbacteria bacterium]|nr:hypothetical protein [Candidatus Kerfeldbacteria bacterium]
MKSAPTFFLFGLTMAGWVAALLIVLHQMLAPFGGFELQWRHPGQPSTLFSWVQQSGRPTVFHGPDAQLMASHTAIFSLKMPRAANSAILRLTVRGSADLLITAAKKIVVPVSRDQALGTKLYVDLSDLQPFGREYHFAVTNLGAAPTSLTFVRVFIKTQKP